MPPPIKLTPDQFKKILEVHPNHSQTNTVTWKDTWKIAGIIGSVVAAFAAIVIGIMGDKIRAETENMILKHTEILRQELQHSHGDDAKNPKPKDAEVK